MDSRLVAGETGEINMNAIKERVREIAEDGCGIVATDQGQGSGGPGYMGPDELKTGLAAGVFDDAQIVALDQKLLTDALWATEINDDTTTWVQIEFGREQNDTGDNPYFHIGWIWDCDYCGEQNPSHYATYDALESAVRDIAGETLDEYFGEELDKKAAREWFSYATNYVEWRDAAGFVFMAGVTQLSGVPVCWRADDSQ